MLFRLQRQAEAGAARLLRVVCAARLERVARARADGLRARRCPPREGPRRRDRSDPRGGAAGRPHCARRRAGARRRGAAVETSMSMPRPAGLRAAPARAGVVHELEQRLGEMPKKSVAAPASRATNTTSGCGRRAGGRTPRRGRVELGRAARERRQRPAPAPAAGGAAPARAERSARPGARASTSPRSPAGSSRARSSSRSRSRRPATRSRRRRRRRSGRTCR